MLELRVHFDPAPYLAGIDRLIREAYPKATAIALTETAKAAQAAIRADLPKRFIIRSRWVPGGIRFTAADKRDNPIRATVGSVTPFMGLHATGGVRRPTGKKDLAFPVGARRNPREMTRPSRWPGRLYAKKNTFYTTDRQGRKELVARTGRGKAAKYETMYVFGRRAVIKADWPMARVVERVVKTRWPIIQAQALEKATRGRSGFLFQG